MRDAQHLSWKTFKKLGDLSGSKQGKEWTALAMVTAMLEEVGEVASSIMGMEGYKPQDTVATKEMLATRLSDVLFMVFVLAEHYDIGLEEWFMQTTNDRYMAVM